jgi:hypothetical protein
MSVEFQGYDTIYLAQKLSDEKIIDLLSIFFKTPTDRIMLSRHYDWLDKEHDNKSLICEIIELKGKFPLGLYFTIFDKNLTLPMNLKDVVPVAEILGCEVIVDDITTLNPYVWIVIRGRNRYQRVHVDPDKLNSEKEFSIDLVIEEFGEG